jgi:thiol-disulfide isomerase/thioredoxin/DNA-binding beta-propeller fold protein YncE
MSQIRIELRSILFWVLAVGLPVGLFTAWLLMPRRPFEADSVLFAQEKTVTAPELEGGAGWLNTAKPISIHKDLKGKVVVLDFWTFCCINCIHTLPDLAKLEQKYPNELVVIGIHSAKFDAEKSTENIRKAVLRYRIRHPVVNDPEQKIWDAYGCQSWPTLFLIDPEGNVAGYTQGEGSYDDLDHAIDKLIKIHRAKKTLDETPLHFALERELELPLNFPGKVLADAKSNRLFIADSTNCRVVITDLDGNKIDVAGVGEPGFQDGPFKSAKFNDPQGLALKDEILYVADRKNHLIRALDLKAKTVKTIAGTGRQDRENRGMGGPALEIGMNSPWDLMFGPDGLLYIAMAGHHQIWTLDLKDNRLDAYAGTGRENILDGSLFTANFAQPSGLTTNGKEIFVADSEVSAIRAVAFGGRGSVRTLVGKGLFTFGDVDGKGPNVRLQHALAVQYVDGKLYVADTYNSKIKVLDPNTAECTTFVGGDPGGWLNGPTFNEPGGLSYANGKLYVADTNAHRIRVVDIKTKDVSTLRLTGVPPVPR